MKQGWEIKKLGEVLTIERGGSPRPIDKYLTNSADGINWIKISHNDSDKKRRFRIQFEGFSKKIPII
jgi:type I restriction enzyme S subunit